MGVEAKRALSSAPPGPWLVSPVLRLLSFVDELPAGATGVLRFGDQGVILLESRRVCWAIAPSLRLRLTDIVRNQTSPRLPRAAVEEICQKCKLSGQPIGEALVASGLVSERGLRSALLKHTAAAIAHLARLGASPDTFTVHTRSSYDLRFSFSACELLAALGGYEDPARAAAAQIELTSTLVQESTGVAFVRTGAASGALAIAVDRDCDLAVYDLVGICNWVSGMFDVARTFDPAACAARATWGGHAGLVTWRVNEVGYVGICASRAAAARLTSKLALRASASFELERAGGEPVA